MAEKSIEERTRKIASQRPEAGKEFEQMQTAQNQLLEIQAAQKQNLMERRVMANSQAEQNQILAQAAEVGAQSVAGNMQLNQATQQTMGRYGLSQPRTSSQTKQQHSESVTRQNVTIHNNTTNITNNTVPANIGGPLQGRPIQFQQPQDGNGGMGKFRNWLNQVFAKQEDAAKRRDREYQRRETALTKSSNRMMRKLEEFSKDITKKLDPRNVGRTIGGQLRTILSVLGLGLMAKNFNKILDWIFGAQNKVENEYIPSIKNFFAWVKGDENARKPGLITKLTEGIENTFNKLFFGSNSTISNQFKEKGLVGALKDMLKSTWEDIATELKRRNELGLATINLDSSRSILSAITHPGEAVFEFLKNITNYLSVIIGGDKAAAKLQATEVVGRKATEHSTTKADRDAVFQKKESVVSTRASAASGKRDRTSSGGDWDVTAGRYELGKLYGKNKQYVEEIEDYRIPSSLVSSNGTLSGSMGSTIAAARQIVSDYTYGASRGNINNARVSNNFKELSRLAEAYKMVVVPYSFVNNSRTGNMLADGKLKDEISAGHIKFAKGFRLFEIDRPKTDKTLLEDRQFGSKFKEFAKNHGLTGVNKTKNSTLIVDFLAPYFTQEGYMLGSDGALQPYKSQASVGSGGDKEVFKFLNKLNGFPLYIRMIVYQGWIKPNDIIIRELSENEVNNLIFIDNAGLKAIYYKGYLSEDQRKKTKQDDIVFDSTKSTVQMIDDTLTGIAKAKGAKEISRDLHPGTLVDDPSKMKQKETSTTSSTGSGGGGSGAGASTGTATTSSSSGTTSSSGGGSVVSEDTETGSAEGTSTTTTTTGGSGTFIYGSEGPFDPGTAAQWAINNYSERSKGIAGGLCSDFVGMALKNGGSGAPGAGTVSNLEDYLIAHGWTDTGDRRNGPWEIGDVAIIYKKKGKRGGNGHTAIYTSQGWISDVKHSANEGGWSDCEEVHIYRYVDNPSVSHSGSPGRNWKKQPNVNHVKYAVQRWWHLGRSKEKWGGVGALFSGTNGRSYNRVPGDKEEVRRVLENPDSTIGDFIRVAYKPVTTKTKWSPEQILSMYNDSNGSGFLKDGGGTATFTTDSDSGSFSGSFDSSEYGTSTFSNFFSDAKNIVKKAWGSLSHKASEGANWVMNKAGDAVDWDASLHNGVSYSGGYPKSQAEKYLYAKYTGKDFGSYTIPDSIKRGSTLQRDEWWAKFFDKEGNLKIKDSDNINPTLVKYLHEIEGELKKGNNLDEYHLKIAAQGLDAEMAHNAAETQDQRRVISALVSRNTTESMAQSFTNE